MNGSRSLRHRLDVDEEEEMDATQEEFKLYGRSGRDLLVARAGYGTLTAHIVGWQQPIATFTVYDLRLVESGRATLKTSLTT